MKNAQTYVDGLFSGYEETPGLADFKEEITSNLKAKIESLIKKGLSEEAASRKAAQELGDISALAGEISLKKRREVFEERYLGIQRYMGRARVLAYVLTALVLAFGLFTALMLFFAGPGQRGDFAFQSLPGFASLSKLTYPQAETASLSSRLTAVFGVLLIFCTGPAAAFTFLALTQETPARDPMPSKRALWYSLGSGALVFGLLLAPLTYLGAEKEASLPAGIAVLIPFALPAGGLLAFLILTEKCRLKPWAQRRGRPEDFFADTAAEIRFGLYSGALWIFALALFLLIVLTAGFTLAWLVFVFATAAQCLLLALMCPKKENAPPAKSA